MRKSKSRDPERRMYEMHERTTPAGLDAPTEWHNVQKAYARMAKGSLMNQLITLARSKVGFPQVCSCPSSSLGEG